MKVSFSPCGWRSFRYQTLHSQHEVEVDLRKWAMVMLRAWRFHWCGCFPPPTRLGSTSSYHLHAGGGLPRFVDGLLVSVRAFSMRVEVSPLHWHS